MYLLQTGNGRLELVNDLNKEWNRMRTGERYFIEYRLDFPVQSPLPTVKSIIVNNQQICRGSKPSKCTDIIHVQSLQICYSQKLQQNNL
jgi:hypothetical protein